MSAVNFWLTSGGLETRRKVMNELVREIQKIGMEPKLESRWWTSTNGQEVKQELIVGKLGRSCVVPFVGELDLLGFRFRHSVKGDLMMDSTLRTGIKSWWSAMPCRRGGKCERAARHVFSFAQHGSINWEWSQAGM